MKLEYSYVIPTVRIAYLTVDPKVSNDIAVEHRVGTEWVTYLTFNSLSDDYAFTNAREAATKLAKL